MAWRRAASVGARQFRKFLRLLLSISFLGISAFVAAPGARAADGIGKVLEPLESAQWPRFLVRLGLPADRAYVVLMQAPPRNPIDLQSTEAAVRSLRANVLDLWSRLRTKTVVGHGMIAWQCASGQGFASLTGDVNDQATAMVMHDGWGITPLLSVFDDGRIDGADGISAALAMTIAHGRGNVVAVEVTETGCQRLRTFVAIYLRHPAHPSRRYGLLLKPGRFEGGGCVSFLLEAAGQAGIFAATPRVFTRRLDIPRSIVGRRSSAPDGVEPFAKARSKADQRTVSLDLLLSGPWSGDEGYVRVSLSDPELLFVAITCARTSASSAADWRVKRSLPDTDPAVARACRTGKRLARQFFRHRIADPRGTSALVLERR